MVPRLEYGRRVCAILRFLTVLSFGMKWLVPGIINSPLSRSIPSSQSQLFTGYAQLWCLFKANWKG